MAIPGFTAEESLYRTTGQYRAAPAHSQNQAVVTPAQSSCTTFDVTLTDCCNPDPYMPNCWRCSRTDSSGWVWSTWDQGDCTTVPPSCTPSTTWRWDEQGCKEWTIIHEDCRKEIIVEDCPLPNSGRERSPGRLTVLKR